MNEAATIADAAPAGSRPLTIGERIRQLASRHGESPALIVVGVNGAEKIVRWHQLEAASNRAARALQRAGVDATTVVGIALPHGADHVVAALGAWKRGAMVVPLDPHATAGEIDRVRAIAGLQMLVAPPGRGTITPDAWARGDVDAGPLSPCGTPRSAHATGGSTGRPRIIVRRRAWTYTPGELPSSSDTAIGLALGQVQLVMLPLHQAGFTRLHHSLALDHTVVLMERFIPEWFPHLVRRHRVSVVQLAPTMMRRLLAVPDLASGDLSSIEAIHHGFAHCPPAVKRAWLDLVGPERVYEGYGSNERIGDFWIRGDEWLEHPGSVGRVSPSCDARVYDDAGREAEPGEVGEIFLRSPETRQPVYLGSGRPLPERDGFLSVGDVGYLDENGYLYVLDRRVDIVSVGGTKVYPAEVEDILLQMPGVRDAAVVPRAHELLGSTVHALIVPTSHTEAPSVAQLYDHCRQHLSAVKVPISYEFVTDIGRTDAGKIRRRALRTHVPPAQFSSS